MTVSVKITVNGQYKLPVTYRQGGVEKSLVIYGNKKENQGPHEETIPFVHGADAMTLSIGPEEYATERPPETPPPADELAHHAKGEKHATLHAKPHTK